MTIELISKIPQVNTGYLYPTISPAVLGSKASSSFGLADIVPGFAGNGDYIKLPYTGETTLYYYSNANVLLWSKAVTSIHANCDLWVGFTYDNIDNIIYGVAVDTGTSPYTYYTFSINSAGTITNIGNAVPLASYTAAWVTQVSVGGSSLIQRVSPGSGNLKLRSTTQTGGLECELSIINGVFTSQPTTIYDGYSFYFMCDYKNSNGVSIGGFIVQPTGALVQISKRYPVRIVLPYTCGVPSHSYDGHGLKPIVWGDYIALVSVHNYPYIFGPVLFDRTEFDAWMDDLAEVAGIN